jgi:hypothetical protein
MGELTLNDALQAFIQAYLGNYSYGETRNSYYCGITDDLDRRSKEHNATFIKTMEADTFEGAKELEKALDRVGFDAGDHVGNGTEKSVFIYMYKKIPGVTKE